MNYVILRPESRGIDRLIALSVRGKTLSFAFNRLKDELPCSTAVSGPGVDLAVTAEQKTQSKLPVIACSFRSRRRSFLSFGGAWPFSSDS